MRFAILTPFFCFVLIFSPLCAADPGNSPSDTVRTATVPFASTTGKARFTLQDILRLPVDNYIGVLSLVPTATLEDDGVRFHNGRADETVYQLDGLTLISPHFRQRPIPLPLFALDNVVAKLSPSDDQYSFGAFGAVAMTTLEGGGNFQAQARYSTSALDFSRGNSPIRPDEVTEDLQRLEIGLSGPVPLASRWLPGRLSYLLAGDYRATQGRFLNEDGLFGTAYGKLTYRQKNFKLQIFGLNDQGKYNYFDNLWKQTVREDDLYSGREGFESWAGNGILDTEDIGLDNGTGIIIGAGNGRIDYIDLNGNGEWDDYELTEDLNYNGRVDSEDLNHNGQLDTHNMLDHLADLESKTTLTGFSLTHRLSDRTWYQISLARHSTRDFRNVKEIINEDLDGDERLDDQDEWVRNLDGSYYWSDLDGDGYFDRGREDLNGNGSLDEFGSDLFTDHNHNGFVDASENGPSPRNYFLRMGYDDPESDWMPWSGIPYLGQKDHNGFYSYGAGMTWDRNAWELNTSSDDQVRFLLSSRALPLQHLLLGFDLDRYRLFHYRAVDRYGYGFEYERHPSGWGVFLDDRISFANAWMKVGWLYQSFDFDYSAAANPRDPTWDWGEVYFSGDEDTNSNGRLDPGEDLNGNGFLDQDWIPEKYQVGIDGDGFPVYSVYPGDIKDPRRSTNYASHNPRLALGVRFLGRHELRASYGVYPLHPLSAGFYSAYFNFNHPSINLKVHREVVYEVAYLYSILKGRGWIEFKYRASEWAQDDTLRNDRIEINEGQNLSNIDFGTGEYEDYTAILILPSLNVGPLNLNGRGVYAQRKSANPIDGRTQTLALHVGVATLERLGPILGGFKLNAFYRHTSQSPIHFHGRIAVDSLSMPPIATLDVRLGKSISLGSSVAELFLDIRNLLNRKNLLTLADEEWYALYDGDGDGEPDYDPMGKYQDPRVYDHGRLVRLGLQVSF